jgi:hypothetical protein
MGLSFEFVRHEIPKVSHAPRHDVTLAASICHIFLMLPYFEKLHCFVKVVFGRDIAARRCAFDGCISYASIMKCKLDSDDVQKLHRCVCCIFLPAFIWTHKISLVRLFYFPGRWLYTLSAFF